MDKDRSKSLAPHTGKVFEAISRLDCIKPFTLVGGTALVICLFIGYLLCCCTTLKNDCINYEIAQKETLVKVYAKIITSGSIEFLRYENGYYRLSVYSYRLDMKNKTPYCTLRKDTLYKADDLFNICREGNWMTSSIFKQYGNYDPYFRCFSEDFLELSNDKKIEVLNEISKRRILQGH